MATRDRKSPAIADNSSSSFDERAEPLSLAEELARERNARKSKGDAADAKYEQLKQSDDTHIVELQRMTMPELIEEARKENLSDCQGEKKQENGPNARHEPWSTPGTRSYLLSHRLWPV